jgi:hypothetical protein
MILELTKSEASFNKSFEKDSILAQNLNSNLIIERSTDQLKICIDEDSCDLSYDNYDMKSTFTEMHNVAENRNRIHKMISKKTKFENKTFFEMFASSNKNSKTSFNNFLNNPTISGKNYPSKPTHKHSQSDYNQITPTTFNSKNYKISPPSCRDCFAHFTISKNSAFRKRCQECHKDHFAKKSKFKNDKLLNQTIGIEANLNQTSNSNTANQYSYKAGKTNQICLSCKASFIVPIALAKQRKTCYYCFKSGKVGKE